MHGHCWHRQPSVGVSVTWQLPQGSTLQGVGTGGAIRASRPDPLPPEQHFDGMDLLPASKKRWEGGGCGGPAPLRLVAIEKGSRSEMLQPARGDWTLMPLTSKGTCTLIERKSLHLATLYVSYKINNYMAVWLFQTHICCSVCSVSVYIPPKKLHSLCCHFDFRSVKNIPLAERTFPSWRKFSFSNDQRWLQRRKTTTLYCIYVILLLHTQMDTNAPILFTCAAVL